MHHVVTYGLTGCIIFSTSCHKWHDVIKDVIDHKMCVLISSATFEWNISHSKKNWARYDKKCVSVFISSTSYFCQILMILEFSLQFFEKFSIWNFMVIHPMGVKLFHAGGWMDRQHNFVNVFRKLITLLHKINRLTPNDPYMGRTAPLTSKRCILYIYSTNIGTEYFKHALYSPFFLFKMQFGS